MMNNGEPSFDFYDPTDYSNLEKKRQSEEESKEHAPTPLAVVPA